MIRSIFALALLATLAPVAVSAPPATPAPTAAAATPAAAPASAPKRGPELPPTLQKARELLEKKDFEGAVKILRTEAEKGNAIAANALGEMYIAGRGVKASAVDAQKWFEKADAAGLPEGTFNLATLLARGAEGVPKNETKAKFLTKTAAEAGHPDAQVLMGNAAENAAGAKPGTPDFTEARTWFEKAAAQNNAGGLLALMHYADKGMAGPVDPQKATEYCRRAALAGSSVAMNEMGVRYQRGQGLTEDRVAAIGWFSLAAQFGQPSAFVNLGFCYETGNGVAPDLDAAGRNYAAASKLGFGPAQYRLGQLFEQGKGTKQNLSYAFVLYTRAGAQGNDEAKKKAEEIKSKLTPAQLDEAEKMLKSGSNPDSKAPGHDEPVKK